MAAVPGAAEFLDRTRHLKRAIASSSSTEWLALALERIGLAHHFEGHLYSAADMDRAERHFREAVKANPKHLEANQEIRLIEMRKKKAAEPKKGGGGGFFG